MEHNELARKILKQTKLDENRHSLFNLIIDTEKIKTYLSNIK